MYLTLVDFIEELHANSVVSVQRNRTLQPLIDMIKLNQYDVAGIQLNFICTHNSRRSILAQVWAQLAAHYYGIANVTCYSGGTEQTSIASRILTTLSEQGLCIAALTDGTNPVYAIKYAENALPIIGFSKKYDHAFNPVSSFIAVLTCSQADVGCPYVAGAKSRIPITYEDPKIADSTENEAAVYADCSIQIASEMFYVFSQIKK